MNKLKINTTGYLKNSKTNKNEYNVIPSGNITTKNMAFPIFANGKLLMPDTGDYKFDTNYVVETPALNKGGKMKAKLKKKKVQKLQTGGAPVIDPSNPTAGNGMGESIWGSQNFAVTPGSGSSTPADAPTPFDFKKMLPGAIGAAGFGMSLLSPHKEFTGYGNAPSANFSDVMTGAKAGMAFGPYGAAIGAGLGGIKDVVEMDKNNKDWLQNITDERGKERADYLQTHKGDYGQFGYMQGNPNRQVYSLAEGGMPGDESLDCGPGGHCSAYNDSAGGPLHSLLHLGKNIFHGSHSNIPRANVKAYESHKVVPVPKKVIPQPDTIGHQNTRFLADGGNVPEDQLRNLSTVIANDQTSHSVSLSKQHGGKVPDELNELFDRAMQESDGDEEKAHALVMKHAENPGMKHNKARLKKKAA